MSDLGEGFALMFKLIGCAFLGLLILLAVSWVGFAVLWGLRG